MAAKQPKPIIVEARYALKRNKQFTGVVCYRIRASTYGILIMTQFNDIYCIHVAEILKQARKSCRKKENAMSKNEDKELSAHLMARRRQETWQWPAATSLWYSCTIKLFDRIHPGIQVWQQSANRLGCDASAVWVAGQLWTAARSGYKVEVTIEERPAEDDTRTDPLKAVR